MKSSVYFWFLKDTIYLFINLYLVRLLFVQNIVISPLVRDYNLPSLSTIYYFKNNSLKHSTNFESQMTPSQRFASKSNS